MLSGDTVDIIVVENYVDNVKNSRLKGYYSTFFNNFEVMNIHEL